MGDRIFLTRADALTVGDEIADRGCVLSVEPTKPGTIGAGPRGGRYVLRAIDGFVTITTTKGTFHAYSGTSYRVVVRADIHGNITATEGVSRCHCGSKYWEHDVCVDCGTRHVALIHDKEI